MRRACCYRSAPGVGHLQIPDSPRWSHLQMPLRLAAPHPRQGEGNTLTKLGKCLGAGEGPPEPSVPCPSAGISSALLWKTAVGVPELPASNRNSALNTCRIQVIQDATDAQRRKLSAAKNRNRNEDLTTKISSRKVGRMRDQTKNGGAKNVCVCVCQNSLQCH